MITIQQFTVAHRCRLVTDECGDAVIVGKRGRIYEYGDGVFGAMYMGHPANGRGWNKFKASFKTLRSGVLQDGDCEGAILFDPQVPAEAKLAIKALSCRRKRQYSPEQRAKMAGRLAKVRKVAVKGLLT